MLQMFFWELGQNLQNSYFNEIFSMYAKQKLRPVVSPGGNKRA